MYILPIGSGKGGVGKSLVAANLAIALGQAGYRVVLADLDLGGSNIHTILGMRAVTRGVGAFLGAKRSSLEDFLLETEYRGVRFLAGDAEIPGMANLKSAQKNRLMRQLKKIDADYLIVDLGAGTGYTTLDFFLLSGSGLVVTTPTLTAILNAYLFLKNAVFRIMYSSFPRGSAARTHLDELQSDGNALQKVYVPTLVARLRELDEAPFLDYQRTLARFRPRLLLNMLDDPADDEKATKLRRSVREYLGFDLEHLGIIYRDELQDIALGSRLPIVRYKPNSVLAQAIYRIADKVVASSEADDNVVEIGELDETYMEAELEAEADFNAKLTYVEELLGSGTLTMGDLVETVRLQQFEISRLKTENQLLKQRLVETNAPIGPAATGTGGERSRRSS